MSVDRIPPSLAISVGVHVVLGILWCVADVGSSRVEEEVVPPTTVIELVEPAPAEASPVEVVMLDAAALEHVPAIATATATATTRPVATVAPRSAIRARVETAVTEPVKSEPAHDPSPWLNLRKGRDLEGRGRDALRITTPTLERIALGGPESPRSVVATTNEGAIVDPKVRESIVTAEITPGGRGGYKVDDTVFKGRIERDGSVSIKDKSNLQHQFKSWKHVKQVLRTMGPLGLLQIDFDITDAMMRKKKIDPYASRKLAFLDQTRDARVELGRQYRSQVLARTSEIMVQNLELVWASVTDPAKRKQALFEIWDEVDETGEEEVAAAGAAARAAVIGFIRGRLPSSGPNAFTADEIERLNRKRQSRAAFVPYE